MVAYDIISIIITITYGSMYMLQTFKCAHNSAYRLGRCPRPGNYNDVTHTHTHINTIAKHRASHILMITIQRCTLIEVTKP